MGKIKGIKGFDKNLKCRDFQYEIGKTYACEGVIKVCHYGFHSIPENKSPLAVLDFYPPVSDYGVLNRYCTVESEGCISEGGNKIASSKITIGEEIDIVNLVHRHIEWVKKNLNPERIAKETGYHSAATHTGDFSATMNDGECSAATNTGDCSEAVNLKLCSVATNTGTHSVTINKGAGSTAASTGIFSTATTIGNDSVALTTGDESAAEVKGSDSIAISCGENGKARASLGSAIVIAERGEWDGRVYPLINIKSAIIDGIKLKPDTWYTLKDGEFVKYD